jgi:transglutaminase-like putative cysteine protease
MSSAGVLSIRPDSANDRWRLPWPLLATALLAMLALFLTHPFPALPLMAMLLVASQLTDLRLTGPRSTGWAMRMAVFSAIIILVGIPDENIRFWYIKEKYTTLVGDLLSAEIVIRSWRRPANIPASRLHGVILFCSTMVLGCACNNYERERMQVIGPVFAIFAVLSLRAMSSGGRSRIWPNAMRTAAFTVAMAIGFFVVQTVSTFDQRLMNWAMNYFRQPLRTSDIGLATAPMLGSSFNPEPSLQRVLVISGTQSATHVRAASFDLFSENEWRPSVRERKFLPVLPDELLPKEPGKTLSFRIVGETYDLLLLPLETAGIISTAELEREGGGAIQFAKEVADPRYDVILPAPRANAEPALQSGPANLALDESRQKSALSLSTMTDPRVIELAKRVAGDGPALARATRLVQHLQSHHEYSHQFTMDSADPLSDFILNERPAHCQYFASALTIMCRAVGIPARMVTGYYAHEIDSTDRLVVRDRDAHAWTECWIDGHGWTTFDATPSGGLPDAWSEPVSQWRKMWERVEDFPGMLRQWLGNLSQSMLLVIILIISCLVLVSGLLQLARKKRSAAIRPYAEPDPQLAIIRNQFEAFLRKHGVEKQNNRTWRETTPRDLRCDEFFDFYDQSRFGGSNGERLPRMREILRQLETGNNV